METTSETIGCSQSSQSTNISDVSEASVSAVGRLEKLNSYLDLSGISPVKETTVSLSSCSRTQKNRYIDKAFQVFSAVCDNICPGEGEQLQDLVFRSVLPYNQPQLDNTSRILIDVYRTADTWTFKRQILSILSQNYSYKDIKSVSDML